MTDNPLRSALDVLRAEMMKAEEHLTALADGGAPFDEQLAAAASVSHARRLLVESARTESHSRRDTADAGARALGEVLPEDEDPLSALFA